MWSECFVIATLLGTHEPFQFLSKEKLNALALEFIKDSWLA